MTTQIDRAGLSEEDMKLCRKLREDPWMAPLRSAPQVQDVETKAAMRAAPYALGFALLLLLGIRW